MSTGFRWSCDLKYWSMSFADLLWSMTAPALELKTISDVFYTNSIHEHSHIACTTQLWLHELCVCHVEHDARSSKNHRLEYTKFSLRETWNNCSHLYLTVTAERTKHERPPENTPLGLTLGFHRRNINSIIHSFIHSYCQWRCQKVDMWGCDLFL